MCTVYGSRQALCPARRACLAVGSRARTDFIRTPGRDYASGLPDSASLLRSGSGDSCSQTTDRSGPTAGRHSSRRNQPPGQRQPPSDLPRSLALQLIPLGPWTMGKFSRPYAPRAGIAAAIPIGGLAAEEPPGVHPAAYGSWNWSWTQSRPTTDRGSPRREC